MGEAINTTKAEWDQICERTHSSWWIFGPPVLNLVNIQSLPNMVTLKPRIRQGWMLLILPIFIVPILWGICYLVTSKSIKPSLAITGILTPCIIVYLYNKANFIKKVTWKPLGQDLKVFYGSLFKTKVLTVSREELECRLRLKKGYIKGGKHETSATHLGLTKLNEPENKLLVLASSDRRDLLPTFETISEFLKGHAIDEPLVDVRLPTGNIINISQAPVGRCKVAGSDELRLSSISHGKAIFQRRLNEMIFPTVILVLIITLCSLPILLKDVVVEDLGEENAFGLILVGVTCAAFFGAIGLYFFIRNGRNWSLIADQTKDCIAIKPATNFFGKEKALCKLSEIAAIQLCSEIAPGVREDDSTIEDYRELNLVLMNPPGGRINIIRSAKFREIPDYARQFAEFLGVPLLDHT
jgi:hypothetical protein